MDKILVREKQILSSIREELSEAAKAQPCPACKEDMEHFAEFMALKINDMNAGSVGDRQLHMKKLKEVDYVNELTDIAIFITKVIRPLTRKNNVPEIYKKVLHDDLEGNRLVKKHLLKADGILEELDKRDKDYTLMQDILRSFIKVTEFKLSVDPLAFYIFDKTIRLGYKTHLLSVMSNMIVGVKSLVNPSRYE